MDEMVLKLLENKYKGIFNPFTKINDKILHSSKLKTFADNKLKMTEMVKFVLDRFENIVGKRQNAGYQPFLLFPLCFLKAAFCRVVKSQVKIWLFLY